VQCARTFQSSIALRVGHRAADARSIIAILLLCATAGTVVDLEVIGTDEEPALAAMIAVFESEDAESADELDAPVNPGEPGAIG
jgi:phosphotransferase system HPr (HPr) family protein